jgi:Skp family chaperone for outer membrane proteins
MKLIKGWRQVVIAVIAVIMLGSLVFMVGANDKNSNGPTGFVDIMRLSTEFKPIVDVQKLIDDETQKMQNKFDAEIKNIKDDTVKQNLFIKYQDDLNKRINELKLDEKLQTAQQQLLNSIRKVAEEQGLNLVLDSSVVYYGNPAHDITDAVLQAGAKIK